MEVVGAGATRITRRVRSRGMRLAPAPASGPTLHPPNPDIYRAGSSRLAPSPYVAGYCAVMSEENVEVVRRFYAPIQGENLVPRMQEAVERVGPDPQTEAVVDFWAEDPAWQHVHPDVEWDTSGSGEPPQRGGRRKSARSGRSGWRHGRATSFGQRCTATSEIGCSSRLRRGHKDGEASQSQCGSSSSTKSATARSSCTGRFSPSRKPSKPPGLTE